MNYAGNFGPSQADSTFFDHDPIAHRGDATAFTVSDAHLLFSGSFERHGRDLIISDQMHHLVVPNYFGGAKRPSLISADGALLDPAVVDALTGHAQYAQAGATSAGKLVGNIAKMTGSASIVRNGVAIDVQVGDAVYQSDVLQTGSSSTVGLVLIDGTAFNLSASSRLMLNDLTYDANSTSNSSFISLIQGAASFVAGQVAKTGDMKVATPAAVIGIRGTAVKMDIASTDGKVDISVIDQQDGQVHSVEVFRCVPVRATDPQTGAACTAGDQIGTVSSNGPSLSVTPTTNFDVSVQQNNKTPAQIAQEFSIFQAAIDTYNIQKQINPNLPQHTENGGGNNVNTGTRYANGSTPAAPPATDPFSEGRGLATPASATDVQVTESVSTTGRVGSSVTVPPVAVSTTAVTEPVALLTPAPGPAPVVPQITANLTFNTSTSADLFIANNATIGGTGAPNAIVRFSVDGSSISATTTADANGVWTFIPTGLADGSHTIIASQTDAFGNVESASLTFTLDTIAPGGGAPSLGGSDTGSSGADNVTADTAPSFVAALGSTVVAGDVVQVLLGGSALAHPIQHVVTAAEVRAGYVSLTVTPGDLGVDGTKLVTIRFSDAAGNNSTSSPLAFVLDTTAPVIAIANGGGPTSQAAQIITGTVGIGDVGATVTILDNSVPIASAVVRPDGSWSSSVTLNNGSNTLVAQVTDLAGNTSDSPAVTFTLNVEPPPNIAPTATNLSTAETYAQGVPLNLVDIVVSDVDSANVTAMLTLSNVAAGSLNTATSGAVTSTYNAATGVWIASGAVADVNALLAGLTLTPAANFNGSFSIATSVSDGVAPPVTGSKTITGTAVDAAPVASPVTLAAGTEDTAYTITAATLLAGVTDVDGPSLSITSVNVESGGGSIVNNGNGTWTYTPAANFNGLVSFNYTASDSSLSSSSTASLTLSAVNDAPVATPVILAAGTEDTAYTITTATLLAGVTDVDGPSLSITAVSVTSGGGSLVDNGNGSWTYTPAANFNGPVSFNYTASDGSLTASSTASLIVNPANDAPTATNLSTAETYTQGIPLNLVDIGVTDVDSANVTATLTLSNVAAGSLSTATSGAVTSTYNAATGVWTASGAIADVNALLAGLTLTPAANFNGSFSIATSVSDGVAPAVTGSKIFTGIAVNDAPVATPVTLTAGTEDTAYTITAATLLTGVTDVDGPSLSITTVSVASGGGSIVNNGNGTWTYTPAANVNGPVSFNYTASDGTLTSSSTASLILNPVNDAPGATPVTLAAGTEDTAYTITAATLLAGVTDVDGPSLSITAVNVASGGGSIVDNGNGSWSYTPAANYSGPVSFNYTASDGSLTASSTASLIVNPANDAPTATNLSTAETYTQGVPLNLVDIVVSDVDSANVTATLTLSNVAAGSLNTATSGAVTSTYNAATGVWTASGAIADVNALLAGLTLTPAANFNGSFSIATSVSDGVAPAVTGSKIFTGIAVNDAPVATPVTLTAGTEDTAYTITAATLLTGVTDVDGPSLSITTVSVASGGGSIVNNGNGTWTYTPAANVNGPVSFNYTASDGTLTASSTASLVLNPVNDAPVASPVTLAAGTEDTAYTITAATLLAGVTDVDGPSLSITSVNVASGGGSIVNNGNGSWTYTPAANVNGPVSFSYTASDGTLSSSSTASLTLNPVNDAPVITSASLTVGEGGTVLITPASIGVIDPDSSSFAFTVSNVTHGAFQTTTDGVTWTDASTFTSTDLAASHVRFVHDGSVTAPSFSIQASDRAALDNLSNVFIGSIFFNSVNHAPVASPVTLAAGTEDTAYTITAATLLAGVTDVDGPSLSITSVNVASGGGSIVNNGNGTWTYTPAANFNGLVSFNYTASDSSLSSSSTASLTLSAVNDAPVATPVILATGTEDTAYTITTATLLAGVTDVDGPSLSITAVSVASGGGSLVDNGNGSWTYTPAANFNGPVSFNYTASDGSLTASSTASLIVNPANDAPTATNLSTAETYTQGVSLNLVDIVVTDVDSANVTATLTLSNVAAGSLSTATSGAVTSTYNAATGVWTASGAIADVNALLAGLTLTPAASFSGGFSIATSVSDGVAPAITGSKTFTGIAVNAPPTATNLSATETYTEDTPQNLVDIVVSDVDSANVTATLTLSNVAAGSLNTATSGAVTSTYNAATGVWTASGAIANVNALLAGLTLTPAANFNGSFSIATSISDGVAPAVTGSKTFTGIAVNDAPTTTNMSTAETYTQGIPLNLVDIVVTDVDSANVTATLTLSNVAAGSLNTATSGAVTSTYNAATGVWTASGAIADVNALLAGLTLTPAASFSGGFSIATSVSDGVAPAITGSKTFTGIAVNAPPTATNLSVAETYTEDTPQNLVDIVVSDVDSANVTATLTLSNVAAGSLSTATSGAVTSTYNAATGVWTASGAIANVNALLAGLTLTPAANFNGSFSIATSISDGVAPAVTGSKIFTGIAVNDTPVATPVTLTAGTEDTAYTITAATLLAGVTDVDGPSLSITSVSVVSGGGSILNNGNGSWTYTPAANVNGPVSFSYTASDGTLSSSSTASLVLNPVNDAPVATNLSAAETYTEDTPLNLSDIVVSDVDSANVTATLTLSNVAAGSLNTATSGAVTSTYNAATGVWTASGAIANVNALLAGLTLTPAANFNGSFSIATSISDGVAPAVTGSKIFTGIAVNDAPTTTNMSTAETYTQGIPLNLVDIVVTDVDSANVTATLTLSNVAAGSLNTATSGAVTSTYNAATGVWTASGAIADVNALLAGLTLTPAASFSGGFSIATSVSDGVAPAITGSKAFTGIAVNAPPTATNLSVAETYTEDTPQNLVDIVVSDVDSANVTATLTLSNVAAGSLNTATSGAVTSTYNAATGVWTASGAIANVNALLAGLTLTPAANFNSSFSIATSVSDGVAPAVTGSKIFTGIAVNDTPVATPVTLTAGTEDTAYTITAATLLAGVTDVDGPSLSITSVSVVSGGGSILNNGNGSWTYTPAANVNGPVSFNYTASDGTLTASSTASLVLNPVNDAPVATNLSAAETYTEDTPLNLSDIVVSDIDSANVTATLTLSNAAFGSLSTATSGAVTSTYNAATGVWTASGAIANVNALLAGLTLTPTANFNGSFSIAISVSDGVAPAITGSKTFTGIPVNDAPVASPVTLSTGTANTQYTITAAMLLAGVIDIDGRSSSITSVTVASGGGSIVNNGGGTWTYTPVANYVGPVSFNYVVTDGSLTASSTASLTLGATGTINGTAGADVLVGTNQAESIFGLGGNDTIKGLGGNDQIDGGAGRDFADYSDANDGTGITVDLAAGTVTGGASVGTDSLRSIENIRGTDFADTYNATGFNQNSPNNAQDIPIQSNTNNVFEGGGGNDTIIGSSGSQSSYTTGNGGTQISYAHALAAVTVDLRAGTAFGTAANDVAHVGTDSFSQVNGVIGSDFNDTLSGRDNTLHPDVFFGGAGNDFIDGRVGYDVASYSANFNPGSVTGPISVNLAAGTVTGDASVGTDTLRSIEIIRGTQFNDIYNAAGFGLAGAVNVSDMGSFNQFEGLGGNDIITGNGNTRIDYNFASASVTVDFQLGTAHSTVADDAGIGTDTFDTGVQSVRGSSFNDVFLGSGRNENFLGGRGDDLIDGRNGFDRAVYNTVGDDAVTGGITVNLAAGTVQGDASVGLDTLRSIEAVQGTDFADSYSATGFGTVGSNVGNNGTYNEFEGGSGNDTITGNGNTRIAFYGAAAAVTVNLITGNSQGTAAGDVAAVGTDTFTGVTGIAGSSFADTMTGSDNAANTAEEFGGRGGNDSIDGRGGFDRAFYSDDPTAAGIQVNMAAGTVTGDAAIGTDTLRSVEGIRGTSFADTYVATNFGISGANVGNLGTFNEFEGIGGNDSITGNGNTRIVFYSALAAVTVNLGLGTSRGTAANDVAGVGTDSFTGVNSVRGSNFADTIIGDGNANVFEGRDGDDQLDGRGGADTLTGGNGADTFVYGDGGGADIITDFDRVQGDLIDVSTVSGIVSFADIQSRATVVGGNTVINFGSGNTITLTGVASVQQSDFLFRNASSGSSGADVLVGSSRADAIFGLDGNDILKGLEGDDQLDGGAGRDVADYSDATGGISVNMASGTVAGNASVGNDTLRSVESVRGTDFDDNYLATGFNQTSLNNAQDIQIQSNINNTFEGGGGNDTIIGSSGAQSSYSTGNGGTQVSYAHASGAVTVDLRAGTARGTAANDAAHVGVDSLQFVNGVVGSNFNDTLLGSDSPIHVDVFYGGMGDDTIDGRNGYDIVTYYPFFDPSVVTGPISVNLAVGTVTGDASVGTDTLRSVELVRGTAFNDVYNAVGFGSAGALNVSDTGTFNQFEGMGGNDSIFGNGNTRVDYNFASAAVTVDLQLGTGRSTVADDAGVGNDTMDSGVNSVRGSSFNDTLLGSARNEYLLGGRGDDFIDGRNGFDRAVYSTTSDDAVTSGIVINLAAGTVQGDASVGTDTLRSIEGITGSDFADTYSATGYGLAGAANVGNNGTFNEIEGGAGNDSITGNGNTRVAFYNALAGVTVDLGAGTSRGTAANDLARVGTDTFTGVSSVAGSAFDDTLTGSNNAANTAEEFGGRAGNDFIDGLGGFDRAFYHNDSSALSGINVNLVSGSVTGDAAIGTDTLRSVEGIRGTNFADTFNASNFGAAGFLDAFVNNVGSFGTFNEFEGMGGNDSITGNGNTRIAFYMAADGVTVDLAAGNSHGTAAGDVAGVGSDTFTGVNAVRGSAFGDLVAGGSGNETLDGQGGDDIIQGRGGADTLIGGGGADRFVFNAISDSTAVTSDTISDFVHGTDAIDTSAISGITSVQGLISGSTQIAAHSIVWVQSGANTIVYMNSSAAAQDQSTADMKILLTGITASTLSSSDFFHF